MVKRASDQSRGFSTWTLVAAAAVLFLALAGLMRWMQAGGVRDVLNRGGAAAGVEPPPVAQVQRAVEAMQLVTIRLDTAVSVSAKDVSWRGDVVASVRVPVSLFYGVDLARARVEEYDVGVSRGLLVRVPAPVRLATELYQMTEEAEVQTGWLRWRALSGEAMLGLARKSLGDEARRMVLTPEDQTRVLDDSRTRIERLVKVFVGPRAAVRVEFDKHSGQATDAEGD